MGTLLGHFVVVLVIAVDIGLGVDAISAVADFVSFLIQIR